MRIRTCKPGEHLRPVRVVIKKDGKRSGGPVTYPAGWLPPAPGEQWDERHVVEAGRLGEGDDGWDEVVLTIRERS